MEVDLSKSAFLILHYQNSLLRPEGKFAFAGLPAQMAKHKCIENTAAALKASRDAAMTVIYVSVGCRPGFPELGEKTFPLLESVRQSGAFVIGTWDAEVIDELKPLPSEVAITNYTCNAFAYTELDLILHGRGIKHLFIAGQATNFVVESTTRYGVELGYEITILEDCCAGFTDEMHDFAIANILPQYTTISKSTDFIAALAKK